MDVVFFKVYPLVNIQKAMENGPLIVDLPINSMVMFHSYVSFSKGTFTQPNQKTGQVDSPGKLEHLRSLLNDWEHVS